jgi:hypothetical protein
VLQNSAWFSRSGNKTGHSGRKRLQSDPEAALAARKGETLPRQAVIVLGMHRSGTSAFAGALGCAGLQLPTKALPAQSDNPRGFHEPARLVALNNRALGLANTRWYGIEAIDPACFEGTAADAMVVALGDALLLEYPGQEALVLKDPRLCRLMPLWRRVLARCGMAARIVVPLRDPFEVAGSLNARQGFPLEFGLALWLRHVLDAEHATRGERRLFVSYRQLLDDPRRTVEAIGTALVDGWLPMRPDQVEELLKHVDPALNREAARRKTSRPPTSLDPWLAEADGAHERLLCEPADTEAARRLDRLREEFDAGTLRLAPVVTGMAAAIDALSERLRTAEAETTSFPASMLASLRRMFEQSRR